LIPSYSGSGSKPCSQVLTIFFTRMGVSAMMAAPVLEVGKEEQSPRDQMLLYLTCCMVFGWTLTYPVASPKPLYWMKAGGFYFTFYVTYGGTKWSKSNDWVVISLVSWFSKKALWSWTSINLLLKCLFIPFLSQRSLRILAYFWTPKITATVLWKLKSALIPLFVRRSCVR